MIVAVGSFLFALFFWFYIVPAIVIFVGLIVGGLVCSVIEYFEKVKKFFSVVKS